MANGTHVRGRNPAVVTRRADAAGRSLGRRRVTEERARVRRAEQLLAGVHAELRKADTKATGLLALAGASAVGLAQLVVADEGAVSGVRMLLRWIAFLLWVIAVALLATALAPRTGGHDDARQLAFFGHLRGLGAGRIAATLRRHPRRLPGLISELMWTSRAVTRKYRLISIALILLVFSLVAMIGTAA
ncbi:Pycsar system effector family protein [Actinoplanes sp. GCM10030250]|uniref:Pycsar system effector family protein n=1 Tax=Actinoplanes sp. GCM10030250 TaxID=3273376 RepID=UPI003612B4BB